MQFISTRLKISNKALLGKVMGRDPKVLVMFYLFLFSPIAYGLIFKKYVP